MGFLANFCAIAICLLCELNLCGSHSDQSHPIVSSYTSLPSQQPLLPDCSQQKTDPQSLHEELLIISTLDGKLSALDVGEDGDLKWSKQISPEPLLSSTISNFELTTKGQIVRIVPSLDGNLYLYNGKTIDGIPLSAETLLKSSYKLGDDLVITGGQETNILGINILTGQVYYECGVRGCPASQPNENETFDDLFLVKRITQTVRAIEPRTGREKWHFSVSEPHLSTTPPNQCHSNFDSNHFYDERERKDNVIDSSPEAKRETDFKVVVPNGVISGKRYSKDDGISDSVTWQYKFDSPIVHVWHYKSGHLNPLNLFDKQKLFGFSNVEFDTNILEPSIYIGRFQQQWYVQNSNKVRNQISQSKIQNDLLSSETTKPNSKSTVLQIEWKPRALIYKDNDSLDSDNSLELISRPQFSLSSSSMNEDSLGYYIFDVVDDNKTKCYGNQSKEPLSVDWDHDDDDHDKCADEEDGIIQQIVIASLWHYWREVAAISVVSAVLLNFIYSYFKRKLKLKCKELNYEENSQSVSSTVPIPVTPAQDQTPSTPSLSLPFSQLNYGEFDNFISRYLEDFEPIQLLGKGGFGLVFEAKHRIDESHYAVKRICLPGRKEQRDKVMREVKALSKLDHSGIVRYYNAWVELPPPGWQEEKDKQWDNGDMSEAQFNDIYHQSKQVVNKSLASNHEMSMVFTSKNIHTETNVTYDNSNVISFSENQNSQSLDIVFDENVSYIKVVEANATSSSLLDSGFAHKSVNFNANICESSTKFSELKDIDELKQLKNCSRPNSFNPPPRPCYLYIQMQLCRKDTLKDWLFNNACKRDCDVVLDIFDQIVSAVHYVHSMGLMHRDLKPSNIFFSMDGIIKIGDFGLVTATAVEDSHTPAIGNDYFDENYSSILSQDSNTHTNRVGTQLYMSPEQVKNAPYSHKVDIFSMGIILFELLVPFKTEMERFTLLTNARKQIFPMDFCNKFKSECDLLKQLLSHNPEKRPSTAEIKEHDLLKNIQLANDAAARERRRTMSQSSGDFL